MANEMAGMWDWLDVGGQVRSDVNKVTEEAVRRVQDNQKKAQQIAKQIKDEKDINNNLAKFLSFILKEVKNDSIIKSVYDVFFKIKNPKTDTTYLRKSINIFVIVWLFIPFYPKQMEEMNIIWFYQDIFDTNPSITLTKYINYLKKLSKKYHDNIPLDKNEFIELLTNVLQYFSLINDLDANKKQELKLNLSKELYWK
jgi:hypothetical protein